MEPCDSAEAAEETGAGVDIPPFDATNMLECSLCDNVCFEYDRFFMESRDGFRWGRVCPRKNCTYTLCYACMLRLPAPEFACPACRMPLADAAGVPHELMEWRAAADARAREMTESYDLVYHEMTQIRDIYRHVAGLWQPADESENSNADETTSDEAEDDRDGGGDDDEGRRRSISLRMVLVPQMSLDV